MSRISIVTGAAGGLGSAIAKRFGLAGDKVVVCYRTSAQGAEKVTNDINTGPGEAFMCQVDIRNYNQVRQMVEDTITKWGRIDVLVNAAGGPMNRTEDEFRVVADMEEEAWDLVVDSNLKGTFNCIKAVLPQMMKQRDGHIINVSSGVALSGVRGRANYAAAKAGVIGLAKSVAIEAGEYNIKVNTLCPGLILHERLRANYPPEKYQLIKKHNVLHQTGDPEEFAEFVLHISTMKYISGQTINLDSRILS